MDGRTIDYAVQKQTIAGQSVLGDISEWKYLEDAGRQSAMGILSKYIKYTDKKHPYWTDRYWYFDVEQYQSDLKKFGINVRMAVMEPIKLPSPSEF